MNNTELFSRAFPNNVSPESESHEHGVSKLGYYAVRIHAANVMHHGLGSPHIDAEKSVAEAERLIEALHKRLNQTAPDEGKGDCTVECMGCDRGKECIDSKCLSNKHLAQGRKEQ